MKKGWERKKLSEVCQFINGRAYNKQELLNKGKYTVLRVGNFFTSDHWYYSDLELDEDKYCDTGDLLYAWSASFGPKIWDGGKVIYHYHIWKVVPNTNLITKEFLYHLLGWDKDQIKIDQGAGTTMTHVSKGSMEERLVNIPPLPEQQRIVSLLDEAFESIAGAKVNAERNLVNARELFEAHRQSVFASSHKGWKEKKLGEITEVQSGGTPLRSIEAYWNGDKPWYSSGELNNLYTDEPERKITKLGLDNSNAKLFPKGSLLMGMYDTAALKMSILDREAAFNQAIAGAKPNKEIDLKFVMHAINVIKPEILNQRRGVRQKNLSLEKIKNIPVILPPLAEQRAIVARLDVLSAETKKLEGIYQSKLEGLEELKKSVLARAFEGEM